MGYRGIFLKKMSVSEGIELLAEYCTVNGFDKNTQWKKITHSTNFFGYRKKSNKLVSKNWVSCHPNRGDQKYSVWIDLVTKEIHELLR